MSPMCGSRACDLAIDALYSSTSSSSNYSFLMHSLGKDAVNKEALSICT
jgi:hypothetical protein